MHNRNREKSQIPGEGVKTRKWRLAWEHPVHGKTGVDFIARRSYIPHGMYSSLSISSPYHLLPISSGFFFDSIDLHKVILGEEPGMNSQTFV